MLPFVRDYLGGERGARNNGTCAISIFTILRFKEMALHHALCSKNMTTVRYYLLKKGADPIIRSNNNAYTLLHVAAFLAIDILKLTNYSSITKRWTSIAWTTAGETRWIARSSTNKQTA
jgi:hypothetical protein